MFKKLIVLFNIWLIIILMTGCTNQIKDQQESLEEIRGDNDLFMISSNGNFSISDCADKGLNNEFIMLESKYCGHCKSTLPDFKEACVEKVINPIILDISNESQRSQMESYGINIQFTPTFIFDCNYYVGAKSSEEYLQLLDKLNVKGD